MELVFFPLPFIVVSVNEHNATLSISLVVKEPPFIFKPVCAYFDSFSLPYLSIDKPKQLIISLFYH